MKSITIHLEVNYSKIPNPLAKNSFKVYKSTAIENKRRKKPRYKSNYFDY